MTLEELVGAIAAMISPATTGDNVRERIQNRLLYPESSGILGDYAYRIVCENDEDEISVMLRRIRPSRAAWRAICEYSTNPEFEFRRLLMLAIWELQTSHTRPSGFEGYVATMIAHAAEKERRANSQDPKHDSIDDIHELPADAPEPQRDYLAETLRHLADDPDAAAVVTMRADGKQWADIGQHLGPKRAKAARMRLSRMRIDADEPIYRSCTSTCGVVRERVGDGRWIYQHARNNGGPGGKGARS